MNFPIIQKTYDIIKWLIPKLEKMPRTQKFVLGDRIEIALLDFLQLVTIASKRKRKRDKLEEADAKLMEIRYLIRLIVKLKYMSLLKKLVKTVKTVKAFTIVSLTHDLSRGIT